MALSTASVADVHGSAHALLVIPLKALLTLAGVWALAVDVTLGAIWAWVLRAGDSLVTADKELVFVGASAEEVWVEDSVREHTADFALIDLSVLTSAGSWVSSGAIRASAHLANVDNLIHLSKD